jgi:beta-D-xylosidase 4
MPIMALWLLLLTTLIQSVLVLSTPPVDPTVYPDCQHGPLSRFPICDASLPMIDRAKDIVSRLTVDEKIIRLGEAYGNNSVPRIGLPTYHFRQNAGHGLGGGTLWDKKGLAYSNNTLFPQVINFGASFDRQLARDMGAAISDEARAYSNGGGRSGLNWFSPNLNVFRDPRWGRGQEVAGEDPFLVGEYGVAYVTGLQTGVDSRYYKNVAVLKHFAVYDLENWGAFIRNGYNAVVSNQDLVETYLPSFEAAIKEGRAGSIMCSYNSVNGVPACANSFLMETILRDAWHWVDDGWVVSDCDAVANIYFNHKYTTSPENATAVALIGGLDLACGAFFQQYAGSAYRQGMFNDTVMDRALVRQFLSLIKLGYFDSADQQPYRKIGYDMINSPAHQQLALTAALESFVLLKNDQHTLPIALPSPSSAPALKIALIGPFSQNIGVMQGNNNCPVPYTITLAEAFRSRPNVLLTVVQGVEVNGTSTAGFDAAVKAASAADIVIYAGGLDLSVEDEAHDRWYIGLPGLQNELVVALAAAAKRPITAVIFGGGQADLSVLKASDTVGAILWVGYPGQSGGEAIVRVLLGDFSPAGRLTTTMYPAKYTELVPMTDQSMRPSATNPGRTYKFYTGEAIYPFGHGLSYSTFSYTRTEDKAGPLLQSSYHIADLAPSALTSDRNADIAFWLTINNTGEVVSDVTALAYLSSEVHSDYSGAISPPIKQLFDFTHVRTLAPGDSVAVYFQLSYRSLVHTDQQGHQWLVPGQYRITINNDMEWSHSFTLQGRAECVKKWPGAAWSPTLEPSQARVSEY